MKATPSAGRAWGTIAMLFGIQIINRADKAVLGLAATAMMADLGLSNERYGLIASSFFFLYAIGGIVIGYFFAHRYRPRLILAVALGVWSFSQLPIVFAATFATLLVARMVLGMGESSGTPTCVNVAHEWFPSEKRNLPTSVIMIGAVSGALISAPILSLIIVHHGWRAAFGACAIGGFAMLLLWVLASRDGPYSGIATTDPRGAGVSGRQALRVLNDRSVYGTFLMGFSTDWVVAFTITWLPTFCTKALGFDTGKTGWLLSLVFLAQGVSMVAASALSQYLMSFGISTRIARSGLTATCLLSSALSMILGTQMADPYVSLVFIGLGVGLPCVASTLNPVVLGDIFPPRHRNRLVQMVLCAGTIGSMMAPWVTGKLLGNDASAGWSTPLFVNAAILVFGGVIGIVLVNPERSAHRVREQDEASATFAS